MRRAAVIVAVIAAAATLAAPATSRRHRLHRRPPALARSLTVDEKEWSIRPSQTVVAAGVVHFHAYDRGQDAHNMELIGPNGSIATVFMQPGASGTVTAKLAPGAYHLVCSLYAGTPQSHEARGMDATLTVR